MDQRDMQSGQPFSGAYYTPQPQIPEVPKKPTVRRRTAIVIGVGGLILGAGIGAAGGNSKTTSTTTANAATTGSPKVTATVTATSTRTVSGAAAAAPAPVTTTVTAKAAVAPAAPVTSAAPKPSVVYSTSGDGIKKTASFTTGPDWSVTYTFNCANFGMAGNFQLSVDEGLGDSLANALAEKGGDTSYEHDNPGSHYLSVNSECDWTLKVSNG